MTDQNTPASPIDPAADATNGANNSQPSANTAGGQPPVDPMAPLFPVGKSSDPRDDECLSIFSDEETKAKHAALINHSIAPNNLTFNTQRMSELVASSYSLTYAEKIYFLDIAISKISQEQVDQLLQVFENEQERFAKLHQEHNQKMADIQKKYEDNAKVATDPALMKQKEAAKEQDLSQVQNILDNLD
ncbi:hypothetical protein KA517_05105 [Candidatus Gracilibacteria bacterium]|nr:hypothetical protein [Candidatus Gracilibacteria bacterium]